MGDYINTMAYIEYGVLIAIVITALLLILVASANSNKKLNPLSYIIAIVLATLLTFQMSRLVCACCLDDAVSDVKNIVGMFSQTAANIIGYTTKDVGWFVFSRVMWSVLFCAIAGVGIYFTMETVARNPRRRGRSSRRRSDRSYDDNF